MQTNKLNSLVSKTFCQALRHTPVKLAGLAWLCRFAPQESEMLSTEKSDKKDFSNELHSRDSHSFIHSANIL